MKYEPIIGLEVHVELKTKSKMFCGCSADYFGHEPNTHCCPVCLGLPGALPVPNKKAVEWCIKLGLALNCKVNENSYFERKNYFYPDLPKGYQISQYARPLTYEGYVGYEGYGGKKKIRINRVHMEEDTGKLTHAIIDGEKVSLVDFNRSGVPLVEIVTEPDFNNTDEVVFYLKKLQQIIRYLGISDADMEKGSMRLEPTINLKIKDDSGKTFETPLVEIKNINSFRFVKQALEYEIIRQEGEFNKSHEVKKAGNKTTVGFDENKKITVPQRTKEEANDYRYFPEPDIPPIRFSDSDIANIKCSMPELSDIKMQRFISIYGLSAYDAEILSRDRKIAEYFDETAGIGFHHEVKRKQIANYIINKKIDIDQTLPAELIQIIINDAQKPSIDKGKLNEVINQIVSQNQKAVTDYKNGKSQVIGFLLGKVKQHFPASDTNQIKTALEKHLKN